MIEQLHLSLNLLDNLIAANKPPVIELVKAYNQAVKACEQQEISINELNERRIKLGLLLEQRLEEFSQDPNHFYLNLDAIDEGIILLQALAICRYGVTIGLSKVYYTFVNEKALELVKLHITEFIKTKSIPDLKHALDTLGNYKNLLSTES